VRDDPVVAAIGRGRGGDLDPLGGASAAVAATWTRPGAVAVDGLPIVAAVGVWATSSKAMNSTEMV
jgi:hypothetical protein